MVVSYVLHACNPGHVRNDHTYYLAHTLQHQRASKKEGPVMSHLHAHVSAGLSEKQISSEPFAELTRDEMALGA